MCRTKKLFILTGNDKRIISQLWITLGTFLGVHVAAKARKVLSMSVEIGRMLALAY